MTYLFSHVTEILQRLLKTSNNTYTTSKTGIKMATQYQRREISVDYLHNKKENKLPG